MSRKVWILRKLRVVGILVSSETAVDRLPQVGEGRIGDLKTTGSERLSRSGGNPDAARRAQVQTSYKIGSRGFHWADKGSALCSVEDGSFTVGWRPG